MNNYTNNMTAEQLINYIAIDRPELSQEKMEWQRNHYIKICKEWLAANQRPQGITENTNYKELRKEL